MKQQPEERFHLAQKPLALMKWCVENYTAAGDLVLDPFMGSASTGVAVIKVGGRRFIGCEINPAYFAIAEARLQPRLLE